MLSVLASSPTVAVVGVVVEAFVAITPAPAFD
jgi:hypothetical protein